MKLNNDQLEAVARLESNPDFKVLVQALMDYRGAQVEFALYGQEINAMTSRGMARAATEIVRAIVNARKTLNETRR